MGSPKVSIILTTHGAAPYLKQAIGSVLAQTFEDWELLVALDWPGPGDGSGSESYDLDDRIDNHIYQVPEGTVCRFASTINQAFKQCQGDFITYLCHDDLYLPWRLEEMVGFMDYTKVDVCFGIQQLISSGGAKTSIKPLGRLRQGNPDQPAGSVDHSSVMHRRECFEAAGGWDENAPARYGDAYFWNRLQKAGYKFHCIPEVLDCHRFNQESLSWKLDHPNSIELKSMRVPFPAGYELQTRVNQDGTLTPVAVRKPLQYNEALGLPFEDYKNLRLR